MLIAAYKAENKQSCQTTQYPDGCKRRIVPDPRASQDEDGGVGPPFGTLGVVDNKARDEETLAEADGEQRIEEVNPSEEKCDAVVFVGCCGVCGLLWWYLARCFCGG